MSKVRVGVIGTGGMAQGHIKRIIGREDAEIAALCDIKPEALKKTVAKHKGLDDVPQFADYREMIASGKIDAVHIDTPHTLHYEHIMNSLDAGLNVFSEKPMVCRVDHALNVLKKIDESGKVFVLGYQRHYQPEFLFIRDKIASGEMGEVQFVQGLQCQEWLTAVAGTWRQDPALGGGGQLNDSGSHLLAVLLFTTGLAVERVSAFIDNLGVPVNINSALSLKFVNGAQGNISIVGNAACWHEDLTIWLEKGFFMMRNGTLEVVNEKGKRSTPEKEELPEGTTPDDNYIDAILGKATVGSPAIWGLRVIELTEAAWKSAASGNVEKVKRVNL